MIETVFACSSNQTNSNSKNRSFLLCRRMHTIVQILFTKSLGFPRRLAGLYNRTELVQFFIPPSLSHSCHNASEKTVEAPITKLLGTKS